MRKEKWKKRWRNKWKESGMEELILSDPPRLVKF